MRLRTLLISFVFSLLPMAATAGSGHDHGQGHSHSNTAVNQETAGAKATEIVAALVKRNILEENWASITVSSVEQKILKGNQEWVAIFVNDQTTDADKQKLYVFMTLGGDYIAANFTGK